MYMHSAVCAVSTHVCLFLCPSVTLVFCIKTTEPVVKVDGSKGLCFSRQRSFCNSSRFTSQIHVEHKKFVNFSQDLTMYWKQYMIVM